MKKQGGRQTDRAYESDALRLNLACRGAGANIKPQTRRINKLAFSPFLYRCRNLVERFFNKLKHFRAAATRLEKHDANYLALLKLAASRIWMRSYESMPSYQSLIRAQRSRANIFLVPRLRSS